MAKRKRYSVEQIVRKLREAEVEISRGRTVGVDTLFIEAGSPAARSPIFEENGHVESFNGRLRDEMLNLEVFDTLLVARVLVERWRIEYNTFRPPAPEAVPAPLPTRAG